MQIYLLTIAVSSMLSVNSLPLISVLQTGQPISSKEYLG
jgi:hypothetical protein